jgi:Uma2 family endonuclease
MINNSLKACGHGFCTPFILPLLFPYHSDKSVQPAAMTELLTHVKFTVDEYHRMIDLGFLDDKNVELLRGEIIEMPPEGEEHSEQSEDGTQYLIHLLGDRARVRQGKPITLPNGSEPQPDITICQPLGREYRSHHPYPEDIFWVIEYSNSSIDRDLQIKSKIYAEAGIQEYWIVNIQKSELIVMRDFKNGEYSSQLTLQKEAICPLAFPDLGIEAQRIISP